MHAQVPVAWSLFPLSIIMLTASLALIACLNFSCGPLPPFAERPALSQAGGPGPVGSRGHVPRNSVSIRWENDVIGGTDQNYSNGMALNFSRDGRGPLGGIWKWFGAGQGRFVSSYELGQLIVTPSDITRPVPDPADRPYAGLVYAALSTQFADGDTFNGLKFITGVVGPAARGEQIQKGFHRAIGSPTPRGWEYQLKNEPILNVVYEHRRRYTLVRSDAGWGAEVIPVAGGMLGNVLTQAQADGQFRIGFNLPDDFGTTLMRGLGTLPFPRASADPLPVRHGRPQRSFGVYAFAGGGGALVARNLTLDGNTFRDGPRVPKKSAFPAAHAGVSLWTRWFDLTMSYVAWGREYDAQPQASHFGAATLAFRF